MESISQMAFLFFRDKSFSHPCVSFFEMMHSIISAAQLMESIIIDELKRKWDTGKPITKRTVPIKRIFWWIFCRDIKALIASTK